MANISNNKGLTLIESLISGLLVLIIVAGILGAFAIGKETIDHVKHAMAVRNILRAKMENEKNMNYYDVATETDQIVSIDCGKDKTQNTADDITGTLKVMVTDMGGYKKVQLTVSWNESRFGAYVPKTESVETYISRVITGT